MTEIKWVCVGYHQDRNINGALAYMRDTAIQAESICRELHPNFDIYYTKRVDD